MRHQETKTAKKIGLLGGSFNPAHQGHVYVSERAVSLLGLDEVWWIVAQQNPLKESGNMAPFFARLYQAKEVAAQHKGIVVSDFEAQANITYSYDTIRNLKALYPHHFVWLMGADNLIQLPKWYKWQDIVKSIPIAVFNRDNLKGQALTGETATHYAKNKITDLKQLVTAKAPAWAFLDIEALPISSTMIRDKR